MRVGDAHDHHKIPADDVHHAEEISTVLLTAKAQALVSMIRPRRAQTSHLEVRSSCQSQLRLSGGIWVEQGLFCHAP